jgi:GxxExxY protein
MDVYYRLGCGFAEPVYQEALAYEFGLRRIPFTEQTKLRIAYKDHLLKKGYRADFVCFGRIIVEIKAQSGLMPVDLAQVINYLKAAEFRVGLLFNFGSSVDLEKKRLVV